MLLGILLLASCGSNGKEESNKKDSKETVIEDTIQTIDENNDATQYALPSPMQIATILKKSGLTYISGITIPVENNNRYSTGDMTCKSLGMGLYLADLSYCILNKQNQESKKYFKTCSELAESIGLAKAFQEKNIPSRMEKNMNNEDSISKILSEIQLEADNTLEENKQTNISVLIFTGAWIETMFIGTKVHSRQNNARVITNVVEQMGIAENIIKALKSTNNEESEAITLLQEMNDLNSMYKGFKSIKEMEAVDPDVIDPTKLTISEEELQAFSKKIDEIRTRIKG